MWQMAEGLAAYTLAERPELLPAALAVGGVGEEFAGHDLIGWAFAVGSRLCDHWPRHTVVLVKEGSVVAACRSRCIRRTGRSCLRRMTSVMWVSREVARPLYVREGRTGAAVPRM